MWLLRTLTAGACLLAGTAAGVAAQEVAGTVVEAKTGKALDGVRVTVQGTGAFARSHNRGRFRLVNLS